MPDENLTPFRYGQAMGRRRRGKLVSVPMIPVAPVASVPNVSHEWVRAAPIIKMKVKPMYDLTALTIIIPYRNEVAALGRLLSTLPADLPVIVVDDVSEVPPIVERPDVKVIRLSRRHYFSGAVNAGIKACNTDVLVMNQDIWFTNHRWRDFIAGKRDAYALIGDGIFGHPAWPAGYVQGTFMFMRRDAIVRVGLLNAADWPLWGATCDWQTRVCRAGFNALPVADHAWFQHERRDRSRFGAAVTAAIEQEPKRKAEFIRTPPVVTVIIPCFNYGRYLADAVNSLVGGPTSLGRAPGQTFTAFEVIVVDDASTDDTQALGEAVANPWAGVHYHRMKRNVGTAEAINAGIRLSHGRAIQVLSADDMLEPDALELHYAALAASPGSLVYGDYKTFADGKRADVWAWPEYDFEKLLRRNHVPAGSMYLKESWEKAGGYPPAFRDGREDWAFNVAAGSVGICGKRVPAVTYLYRREGQNRIAGTIGAEWHKVFMDRMHETFPALYAGERPKGCCKGKKAISPTVGRRVRGAPTDGEIPLHYTGDKNAPVDVFGYRVCAKERNVNATQEDVSALLGTGVFTHGHVAG